MYRLVQLVEAAFDELGVPSDATVMVACSGGPDSTALAHVCAELAQRGRLGAVTLGFVDHQLRPDSAADGEAVAALAQRMNVPIRRARVVVDRSHASLEDAARRVRYPALHAMADAAGARYVATGHTASDQVETLLMRIVRGTGVAGLAGIPARRDRYLRPLLRASRAQVMHALRAAGESWVEDPMNADRGLLRNRVRHEWLPALRRENPGLDEAVLRLARSAGEQREVLEWAAAKFDAAAPIVCKELAASPAAVGKRVLQRAAAAAGIADQLSAANLESLWALVRRPDAGTKTVAVRGGHARREYDVLGFASRARQGHDLDVPRANLGVEPNVEVRGADGPYLIRRWRPGDRMRPTRLRGHSRKLSDLFIDAKVPRARREHALVVERSSDREIVWAEHVGTSYQATVVVTLTRPVTVATNK